MRSFMIAEVRRWGKQGQLWEGQTTSVPLGFIPASQHLVGATPMLNENEAVLGERMEIKSGQCEGRGGRENEEEMVF